MFEGIFTLKMQFLLLSLRKKNIIFVTPTLTVSYPDNDVVFFRYMGTITGIGDLDSVLWPNSHWRSVKVHTLVYNKNHYLQ